MKMKIRKINRKKHYIEDKDYNKLIIYFNKDNKTDKRFKQLTDKQFEYMYLDIAHFIRNKLWNYENKGKITTKQNK